MKADILLMISFDLIRKIIPWSLRSMYHTNQLTSTWDSTLCKTMIPQSSDPVSTTYPQDCRRLRRPLASQWSGATYVRTTHMREYRRALSSNRGANVVASVLVHTHCACCDNRNCARSQHANVRVRMYVHILQIRGIKHIHWDDKTTLSLTTIQPWYISV